MRIKILSADPTIAAHIPKIMYIVPMSLWLVENNHRGKMSD